MNMSRAITQLKMQLGLYNITLPFKNNITHEVMPTENVIRDVLVNVTIPTYSQFNPARREGIAHVNNLECIDDKEYIYILPKFLTVTPIVTVISVEMPQRNNRGTFGDVAPAYGINRSVQGVITSQAYMMTAGVMRSEPSWLYLGENKIQLSGFPKCKLMFKVAAEHDANGETIPDTAYHSFMQLATLDMKVFLYNTLKLYDGMPSPFGQINLKVDEYQGAEGERKELLENWTDRFHLDVIEWYTFM